jgi:hypothetical protein
MTSLEPYKTAFISKKNAIQRKWLRSTAKTKQNQDFSVNVYVFKLCSISP